MSQLAGSQYTQLQSSTETATRCLAEWTAALRNLAVATDGPGTLPAAVKTERLAAMTAILAVRTTLAA